MSKREFDSSTYLKETKEGDRVFARYDQYQRVYCQSILDKSFVYCMQSAELARRLLGSMR